MTRVGEAMLKPGNGEAARLSILGNGKAAPTVRESRYGNPHPREAMRGSAILLLPGARASLEGRGPP